MGDLPRIQGTKGMLNLQSMFDKLMVSDRLEGVPTSHGFKRAGLLIDLSGDLVRDDGNVRALAWCDELAQRKLTSRQKALLDYFRANAWANRQKQKHKDPDSAWEWEQPELQHQILHLRRAIGHPGFSRLSQLRRCQIHTNLGNLLNHLGRFVDAGLMWNSALEGDPRFGMALGNRGYGRLQYARSLYDPGHRNVFLHFARKDLGAALSSTSKYQGGGYKTAKSQFAELKEGIETSVNLARVERHIDVDNHSIGRSKTERQYRRWVLRSCLFLNPLNDLGPYSIAAQDILSLPTFSTSTGDVPPLVGFYNQMKQEFVSGRWLLYEGLHSDKVHFSDRDVLLINTLDNPSYSLAVEKVKAAYRIGYSIFDKIAFFLNDYAKLGINPTSIYFKTIWFEKGDAKKRLIREQFSLSKNWPFRGLYWLSKDLFDPEIQEVMEPEAQQLYIIRNRLEHDYLKVHEVLISGSRTGAPTSMFADRLAYSVARESFNSKTLHIYKLARAALIYLSLGMHVEERHRIGSRQGLAAPMHLDRWRDSWKR